MNNAISIFQYNGNGISFDKRGANTMVNATEMAQAFGKRPAKWLELPSTKEFLNQLLAIRKSDRLVETINGVGTWMHEDVALEFARWLSPAFAIWCNDRIKELLLNGQVSLFQQAIAVPQTYSEALRLAADQAERIEQQKRLIEEQKPRVLFSQAVETSKQSILIGELAKLICQNGYEIGQNRLFKWMRDNDYLCKSGERYNQPTQRAIELGVFEIKKTNITKPSGEVMIQSTTKVTGRGQIFFVNKFLYNSQNKSK